MRVNLAIRDGSFFDNPALVGAFARARERGGDVHLLGLVSQGGVHSHLDHLLALLELARRAGDGGADVDPCVHGRPRRLAARRARPTSPRLPAERIATVVGRYYAMDRDNRAERTERAAAAILTARATQATDPVAAVRASYEAGMTDEFVEPVVLAGRPRLAPGRDAAIFFNFRPDRGRQLSRAPARRRAST